VGAWWVGLEVLEAYMGVDDLLSDCCDVVMVLLRVRWDLIRKRETGGDRCLQNAASRTVMLALCVF